MISYLCVLRDTLIFRANDGAFYSDYCMCMLATIASNCALVA